MKASQMSSLCKVAMATFELLFGVAFAFAAGSDDFWDDRFGDSGFEGVGVYAITVFRDEVYGGGIFSSLGGIRATNIAKWDGTNWSAIGAVGRGSAEGVGVLAASGEALYAAGVFSNAGGVAAKNIAKWDGTNWSALGSGIDAPIFAMATSGSELYAGGSFASAGGIIASNVAKWNGTTWSSLSDGIQGAVFALAARGNEVYAGGGSFSLASGVAATNVVKWDGTNWSALGFGLRDRDGGSGVNGQVHALMVRGQELFAGGNFKLAGTNPATNVAKWDGISWSGVGLGATGTVEAIVPNGEDVYVGGSFLRMDGLLARGIAKWDRLLWSTLGSGFQLGSPIALVATGTDLWAVGDFQIAGNNRSLRVALWHIPHTLNINRTGNQLTLSWPATGTNFVLEANDNATATNWSEVSSSPILHSNECVVTDTIVSPQKFYRLREK